MRKQSALSNKLFHLVVKTPIVSLVLVIFISSFVYYALFQYEIDIELQTQGKWVQDGASEEFALEVLIEHETDRTPFSTTGPVVWNQNGERYTAAIVSVQREGAKSTIVAKPAAQDVSSEFGADPKLEGQAVACHVIIGKERIVDKLSRK